MVGNVLTERLPHIGFVYITMSADDHPAEYFGGGTWEKIEGKFLLAASDAYPVESTGGEAAHTLTIDEMPSHRHNPPIAVHWGGEPQVERRISTTNYKKWTDGDPYNATSATGGDKAHNNLPPYVAAFMYRRIA